MVRILFACVYIEQAIHKLRWQWLGGPEILNIYKNNSNKVPKKDNHICYLKITTYNSFQASVLNFNLNVLDFNIGKQVSLLDYTPSITPIPKGSNHLTAN